MIDLDRIERLVRQWCDDPTGDPDRIDPLADGALVLVAEVRALRAGLETALDEMADGMPLGHNYSADIETLETLAGIEPRHSCSQCGWSGRSFHACEGVPGGFGADA
jgi:hypothetical protein